MDADGGSNSRRHPVRVGPAEPDDLAAVMTVLDAGGLAADAGEVCERTAAGDVLVARAGRGGAVLGALVLDGNEVEAVAVRPGRRGRGIGTALVEAAAERAAGEDDRLVAAFDAGVRPFYESLGFEVGPADEPGRYRGVLGA